MTAQRRKYRIIIIEPSPVVQQGLKTMLELCPDFQVVYSFSDFQSFEEKRIDTENEVEIILINPAIISFHKQFAIRALFAKHTDAVIAAILYNYVDPETINSFDGVLDIYNNGTQLIKKLTKLIEAANQHKNKNNQENVDISDREKEILISVAIGLTNKEIAEKHHISVHTVISHRKNISRKIGIRTVSGLTIYAIFNNLISEDDL